MDWTPPRPIYLPDAHLPHGLDKGPTCRACGTNWPCQTAGEYLLEGRCSCGSRTYRDKRLNRSWHVGPRCYTTADVVRAQAEDLRQYREAHPHYPPSHYYPPKPARPVRQRPPYRHTPAGPGDVQPGTWVWVRPGALHPGWGDIHQLAMVTRLGVPKCEVWLILDGTVHQARADCMILDRSGRAGQRLPDWARWTIAQHLDHAQPAAPPAPEPMQDELFPVPSTEPACA
ncbi:hypothetical protein [Streptomyces sp. NPDC086782]|uniref:hypothetical protein n=1 Tax=Streptomyces sp. NPDC086782 TaxID=3365757 RepID=UPI0037F8348D